MPWTNENAESFWSGRIVKLITRDDKWQNKLANHVSNKAERDARQQEQKDRFLSDNEQRFAGTVANTNTSGYEISQNLRFWIENSSWAFCSNCSSLEKQKLLPGYTKRPQNKNTRHCKCGTDRYSVPLISLVPDVLKNLSYEEVCALRPLDFHIGDVKRQRHGYLQKSGMCHINWSQKTIREKIQGLEHHESRKRCRAAYNFLINCENSCYSDYVERQLAQIDDTKRINLYISSDVEGIECALWPNLYPFKDSCETFISGKDSRLSTKVAFLTKVLSGIIDYGLNYEILQFHYDLWVFKTVSGAISSARLMKCSPARALNAKTFSPGYWKKQHRLLIDAVNQFGYPSVFVTINPYEWSFPSPKWIKAVVNMTGKGATELAGFQTLHIAHVLEQIVRGYLCGSNTNRWNEHFFSFRNSKTQGNINTYFYRFEFQERGTVHLHLLVWLKDITAIQHKYIRADIPYEDPELAWLARNLQASDTRSLPLNLEPTCTEKTENVSRLSLYYPREAFELNMRAYFVTLLQTLQCRMDFQCTDGRGMILRYVTSYVAKWKDAYSNDALYCRDVSPYQAAYRHINDMTPCEPEMWLHMTATKLSWTNSRTKDYPVPHPSKFRHDSTYKKYIVRPENMDNVTFIEWLRLVNHTARQPTTYKSGNTLVSVKYVTPYSDEFFFQYVLMNYAHRSYTELEYGRGDEPPLHIKYFATAIKLFTSLWSDQEAVSQYFRQQGNRAHYVTTLCSYIASLCDTLQLWQRKVISREMFLGNCSQQEELFPLDHIQTSIYQFVIQCLAIRDNHYRRLVPSDNSWSSDGSEDEFYEEEHCTDVSVTVSNLDDCDWKKFILITGEPGTGKSQIAKHLITKCTRENRSVLVACPIGILASSYKEMFEDVTCDTIHSIFQFPVNKNERATINWDISRFDLVVIDELSMVTKSIMEHVIRTIQELAIRPVVVMCGDECQQQPIETVQNRIIQVNNIFSEKSFYSITHRYKLKAQHRVVDQTYQNFLNHIRYWKPSQGLLDRIQHGRVVCPDKEPADEDIVKVLLSHKGASILTVSRKAVNRVNAAIISALFKTAHALATIQFDNDLPPSPVYKDMRVIITQNRDKKNGIVNGKQAVVFSVQKATIFLKFNDGKIGTIYPVTSIEADQERRACYPIVPGYALTIAKSQGQNLDKVIVWFDTNTAPPASAYVALSRVKKNEELITLSRIKSAHVQPVT